MSEEDLYIEDQDEKEFDTVVKEIIKYEDSQQVMMDHQSDSEDDESEDRNDIIYEKRIQFKTAGNDSYQHDQISCSSEGLDEDLTDLEEN